MLFLYRLLSKSSAQKRSGFAEAPMTVFEIGVGPFLIFLLCVVALAFFFGGWYLFPQGVPIFLVISVALPLVIFVLLRAAFDYSQPLVNEESNSSGTALGVLDGYREKGYDPSTFTAVDTYIPIRLVVFILLLLGLVGGVGVYVALRLLEPPYKVPRMRCLRDQLAEAHPSWIK